MLNLETLERELVYDIDADAQVNVAKRVAAYKAK